MLSKPFYDPLSERWIQPRPERLDLPRYQSFAEAFSAPVLEAIRQAEAERIWAITRQVAEGCNISTRESGETACQD